MAPGTTSARLRADDGDDAPVEPPASDARPRVDGRAARRLRNRDAVLDAVVTLFADGQLDPSVHEVADRSGVSLRSVYRYFDDRGDLFAAAIERERGQTAVEPGSGTTDERIRDFARTRVSRFEDLRAVHAAATARARIDQAVANALGEWRDELAADAERWFREELDTSEPAVARTIALTIDVLSQFDTIELLRHARGLGVEATVSFLADAIADLLSDE